MDEARRALVAAGADPSDVARYDAALSRRGFLGGAAGAGAALGAVAALGAGAEAALAGLFGRGLLPAAWAQDEDVPGGEPPPEKAGGTVLSSHPLNLEMAPHLLDDDVTPTARHFVRNNGPVPPRAAARDAAGWTLAIEGEVERPLSLGLEELGRMATVTQPVVLECAGNGRSYFDPPVRGNQWANGAVSCSEWTGVPLRDLLERAGVKKSARYTGHYGADAGIGKAEPFSRGIPIEKALDGRTMVAIRMNGEPLPPLHGFPARLLVPGWIGSCSQKWLTRIVVRDREHDSEKMRGYSYRMPAHPVAPGTKPPESDMVVATTLVVKSLVTRPAGASKVAAGAKVPVAGHAWAGERKVARVAVSTDYGVTWTDARLAPPPAPNAWARFEAEVSLPRRGYYEVWARAFDDAGDAQPFRQPWNPKGYLSNVVHRVPVEAV